MRNHIAAAIAAPFPVVVPNQPDPASEFETRPVPSVRDLDQMPPRRTHVHAFDIEIDRPPVAATRTGLVPDAPLGLDPSDLTYCAMREAARVTPADPTTTLQTLPPPGRGSMPAERRALPLPPYLGGFQGLRRHGRALHR